MTDNPWLRWPSREALDRKGASSARRALGWLLRLLMIGIVLRSAVSGPHEHGWKLAAGGAIVLVAVGASRAFSVVTLTHRLVPSLLLLTLLLGLAVTAEALGFGSPAIVLWCGCAVVALERLPMGAALPFASVALSAFAAVNEDMWLTTAATLGALALAGYTLRLDNEARGNAARLLAQERAARAAEAESAALTERARIAREIHDVLAHSLSAQLVHLEAARLLIERDADRGQILDRVVAARAMARDGLEETRQALSALRGDLTPLEDFLTGLVRAVDGAQVTVRGEHRPLSAEVSQAVRRVAQEALTNVRKHAPGARVSLRLEYGPDEVTLDVRDSGGPPGELAGTGGGYGLLGMRERAELLGGSLEAGPDEEGFAVRLRVPV
ncbi:sensor histidine kinase [Streptomyces sp. S6]